MICVYVKEIIKFLTIGLFDMSSFPCICIRIQIQRPSTEKPAMCRIRQETETHKTPSVTLLQSLAMNRISVICSLQCLLSLLISHLKRKKCFASITLNHYSYKCGSFCLSITLLSTSSLKLSITSTPLALLKRMTSDHMTSEYLCIVAQGEL